MKDSIRALLGSLLAAILVTGCGNEPEPPKSVLLSLNGHTGNILMDVVHNGSVIVDNVPPGRARGGYSPRGSDLRFSLTDQSGNNLGTSNLIEVGEKSIQGVILAGHAGSTDVFAVSVPITSEENGVFVHAAKSLPNIKLLGYKRGTAITVPLSYKQHHGFEGDAFDSIVFRDGADRRLLVDWVSNCGSNFMMVLHDTTSGKPPKISTMHFGKCPS